MYGWDAQMECGDRMEDGRHQYGKEKGTETKSGCVMVRGEPGKEGKEGIVLETLSPGLSEQFSTALRDSKRQYHLCTPRNILPSLDMLQNMRKSSPWH